MATFIIKFKFILFKDVYTNIFRLILNICYENEKSDRLLNQIAT